MRREKGLHVGRIAGAVMAIGCILLGSPVAAAADLAANLDRDTVYLGTQTLLSVDVANPAANEWPVVAPVDGLRISRYGSPNMVMEPFSGTVRRTYRFLIEPLRTGDFTIPSVTLGSGANATTRGPFTLRVREAELKFYGCKLDPQQILPGEKATLTIAFQGYRHGKPLELPTIKGLLLRPPAPPRVEMTRAEGLPISSYQVEVVGVDAGTYEIKGFKLDGVAADAVTLRVSPFIVSASKADDPTLTVGDKTTAYVLVRGVRPSAGVSLVAPAGLQIGPGVPSAQPGGAVVFGFQVTATEPGSLAIRTLKLADGIDLPIIPPLVLSVRQAGEAGILAASGSARSAETIVGEPFIVDYHVFFRGDLQAAGIDLDQAAFANRPYIKVEPINDVSYKDWSGESMQVSFGPKGRVTVLSGAGELNGQKEQMLRFAVRITPLAAGEIELRGLRVVVQLGFEVVQRGPGTFFQRSGSQQYATTIDASVHRVLDPPGKRQPPGYRGAVGDSFTFATSLDRTTATAMSPLTLTMRITGQSVGPDFKPPVLADVPELVRDFDISLDVGGGEVQGNTISFTQVVQPRSEAVRELPALPFFFYNYVKKDYETVYSLPIPMTVAPGSVVGAAAMQARVSGDSALAGGVAASRPDDDVVSLGANHADLGRLQAGALLGPRGVMIVLLAGPVAIVALAGGRKWLERRQPLAAVRRQKSELAAALDTAAGREDFYVAISGLLQDYLRLTFGLPPGEISAGTLSKALAGSGARAELRQEIGEILARCDTGRFAAAGVDAGEKAQLVAQVRGLLASLDRE